MNTLFPPKPLRRLDGRFATREQAIADRLRVRNKVLEARNQYLERKLKALETAILNRQLVYTTKGRKLPIVEDFFIPELPNVSTITN